MRLTPEVRASRVPVRHHGPLGREAYDARTAEEELLALREVTADLKQANSALKAELVKKDTRIRHLSGRSEGVPAAGVPSDHVRLAKELMSKVEDLEMQLESRTATESRLLTRSASLGQYAAPFSARSPYVAGRSRTHALRETLHLEPLLSPSSRSPRSTIDPHSPGRSPGRSPRSVTASELSALSSPASPSRLIKLKQPLPAVPTLGARPTPPPSWRDALVRASASLQALTAMVQDGSASHEEVVEFREAYRQAASVLVSAGLASVEPVTKEAPATAAGGDWMLTKDPEADAGEAAEAGYEDEGFEAD